MLLETHLLTILVPWTKLLLLPLVRVGCMATSRYLPSLAEAMIYVRSALFLEDVFPDGWTLRLGDGAEGLTPGVAAKREESPLLIRATLGEQDTKAVSEDQGHHPFGT